MSNDLTALIAITFLGFMGCFCIFFVSKLTNDLGAHIVTGRIGGNPISTKTRSVMLYQSWAPYGTGAVAAGVLLAVAELRMADHVGDANIKLVAHLIAFIGTVAAVMWLVGGAVALLHYRSVLREGEAE